MNPTGSARRRERLRTGEKAKATPVRGGVRRAQREHSLGASLFPSGLHQGLGNLDIVAIHDVVAPLHRLSAADGVSGRQWKGIKSCGQRTSDPCPGLNTHACRGTTADVPLGAVGSHKRRHDCLCDGGLLPAHVY